MNFTGPKASIAIENLRNLVLSLTLASYLTAFRLEWLVTIFGVVMGAYYGLKIERETFFS